jgi:putative tryptophan/tyrosine transport system substrate-binding protein
MIPMRRRDLLLCLGSAAVVWPVPSLGQQARVATIGVLLVGNLEPFWGQFREGLRDFGYVDGQNIKIEFRSAEGKPHILPDLAADLVRLKVDLIVASETPAVQAARQATSVIPIVMAPSGDPVGTGQVASLAKPGGNVTGLSAATAELAGKSVELIRELVPNARRIAALADPSNPFTKPFLEQIQLAANALAIEIHVHMVREVGDFDAAFASMSRAMVDAVIVQPTLPRKRAVELVLQHKLPAVSGNRAFADAGGLLSYAASLADGYREAGAYVDKILKGRNPGDLPVQQPTKFELVINLKTAQALGLTIPPTMLLRADELIK